MGILHTARRTFRQASSIYDVYPSGVGVSGAVGRPSTLAEESLSFDVRYKLQPELEKSVKILSGFALRMVDAIARTAELLKNNPECCTYCVPSGGCCGS